MSVQNRLLACSSSSHLSHHEAAVVARRNRLRNSCVSVFLFVAKSLLTFAKLRFFRSLLLVCSSTVTTSRVLEQREPDSLINLGKWSIKKRVDPHLAEAIRNWRISCTLASSFPSNASFHDTTPL